jgi:hypothetical protein
VYGQAVHPRSALSGLAAAGLTRQPPDAGRDLRAYPYLEAEDIDEALRYAASLAEDETVELAGLSSWSTCL